MMRALHFYPKHTPPPQLALHPGLPALRLHLADHAWEFAQQLGFSAQVGGKVRLTGCDEQGAFALTAITKPPSGQHIPIREAGERTL